MSEEVVAVHGDFATGEQLRYDMGDPPWVDRYITARTAKDFLDQIPGDARVLIGYSRGAEWIRMAINAGLLPSVRAVVGYEPLALGPFMSTIPRLLIVNKYGRHWWTELGRRSAEHWAGGTGAATLVGRGMHVRLKLKPPFIGHAWDQETNTAVERWVGIFTQDSC